MPTTRIIDTNTGDMQLRQFAPSFGSGLKLARELGRRKGLDIVHKSDNI